MHLLGISSYPARWKHLIRSASVLLIVTALEGIGTLIWLLANPSEPGNRVFLAYSFERWGLILFTAFLVSVVVFMLWSVRNRRDQILTVLEYIEEDKRAAGLLIFLALVSAMLVGLHLALFAMSGTQAHYRQLFPLLAFVTLATLQAFIVLFVTVPRARVRILDAWFPIYKDEQFFFKLTDRRIWIVLILFSFVYLFAQISAGIKVPQAVELGDTTSYLEGARLPLSDPAFFSERRPWGILLIYKMLGGSLAAIGITQLAYSTLAWLFLAWLLVGSFRSNAGKLLGFAFTLGIGLSPTVQVWNHAGLSESFSISTLIVIIALLVGLLQRWKLSFFLALIFFFALWVSVHEVNLYLGLLAAVTLFLFGLIRKNYRTFLVLSFCIMVMFLINSRLSSRYALPRWALPVAEVITKRILPVPPYREYFVSQGMPVTSELMAFSGKWANSENYAILNNPRLRPFSRWLLRDGKTAYANFLIAHPIYALSMPLRNIDEMLAVDFSQLIPGYQPALPALINELFFPTRWFWAYLVISVLLLMIILWRQHREPSRVFWLFVLFFILSIPYLYLAWHGDALDLARHAAIANVQFHLGLWLLFIFFLDRSVLKPQI